MTKIDEKDNICSRTFPACRARVGCSRKFPRFRGRPAAKEKALLYGAACNTIGGPPSVSKMFCSEFAIAVAQSAGIKLLPNGETISTDQLDQLPAYLKLDSFSSPVTVFGEWEKSGAFEMFGPVYTQEDPM